MNSSHRLKPFTAQSAGLAILLAGIGLLGVSAAVSAQSSSAPAPTPVPAPPPPPPPPSSPNPSNFMPPPPAAPPEPTLPVATLLKSGRNVTMPATLNVSGVAALVNGEKVTNEQLIREFLRNGGQPTLQQLITQVELEQAARKAHVTITPLEIDRRLQTTKRQVVEHNPGQTWSDFLASRGLSEDYARGQTRLELLLEKLALAGQPPYSLNDKIHVYHILLATTQLPGGGKPHADADAKKQIEQILADIRAHKLTFQQAAVKYSEDYSNASRGGDLGWIGQGDPLDPAFKQAALQLTEGQISEPVKSQFGWHLIYVSQFGKHASAAQVRDASEGTLQERARPYVSRYVQQLTGSAKVQDLLIPSPPPSRSPSPMMMPPGMRRVPPMPSAPRPMPSAPAHPGAQGAGKSNVPPPPPL